MNKYKTILKIILDSLLPGESGQIRIYLLNFISLITNFYNDGKLFYKHSMVFNQNTFNKKESRIILYYHSLEKGFIHEKFKFRFGYLTVKALIELLKEEEIVRNHKKTQIASAYLAICKYFEKHSENGINISDFYTYEDYMFFKDLETLDLKITKKQNSTDFFKDNDKSFLFFSNSRMSTRSFTGEKIPIETILKVIELAKSSPSVCNRQPTKVYYVEKKNKIDRILELQQGLKGYSEEISQLLIVVTDRNYFYSIGERNQMYIDGGIFLMNLLYALHFYKIGACPAHWGFIGQQDKKIQKELNLTPSEKVVCLIPIGVPKKEFYTTLSLRRNNEEIFKVVD